MTIGWFDLPFDCPKSCVLIPLRIARNLSPIRSNRTKNFRFRFERTRAGHVFVPRMARCSFSRRNANTAGDYGLSTKVWSPRSAMQMVVLMDKWQLYRPSSACQCFASLLLSSGISFEVPEEEASRKGREGEERGRCIMGRFHPSRQILLGQSIFLIMLKLWNLRQSTGVGKTVLMDWIFILLKIQAEAVQAAAAKKLAKKRASQAGCHVWLHDVSTGFLWHVMKSKNDVLGCGRWLALWRQRQRQGREDWRCTTCKASRWMPVDVNTVWRLSTGRTLTQTQQDGTVEATGNDSDDDMGFRMLPSLILVLWLWLAFASKILDLCRGVRLLGSEIGNFAPQKVEHKELKADETDETWICPLPFSDSSYFYDQNSSRWSTWLTSTNAMLLTIRRTCLFRPVIPVMSKKRLKFLHICHSCMILVWFLKEANGEARSAEVGRSREV